MSFRQSAGSKQEWSFWKHTIKLTEILHFSKHIIGLRHERSTV